MRLGIVHEVWKIEERKAIRRLMKGQDSNSVERKGRNGIRTSVTNEDLNDSIL
jgi:hypothetical protein